MKETPNEIDYSADYNPSVHQFYDLMRHRVTKILLVSSLYEAFTLEEDGLLFEKISNEYEDMALSSPPRVNRVSSGEDALEEIRSSRYDLVITMAMLPDMGPQEFGRRVKEIRPDLPVVLLLTERSDLSRYHVPGSYGAIDKVFLWNGDSALFLAITKLIEDKMNAAMDVRTGLVRVILIVEDSPRYYSIFLPLIYSEVLSQNKILINEGYNEQDKLLRKRSRPKIIMAETYEEAMERYGDFKDDLLCIISDIAYPRNGEVSDRAGFDLMTEIGPGIPVLLASTHVDLSEKAREMGAWFVDKNSVTLLASVREFFKTRLGFGDFVFRLADGTEIARASEIREFIELVQTIPSVSLYHHGRGNHFSSWLLARGEVELAAKLKPKRVSDFKDGEEMRNYLIESIKEVRRNRQLGTILEFESQKFEFDGTITRLGGGSLGGKGRGIAFLASLMRQSRLWDRIRGCRVLIPETLIIGTDWFDRFMEMNGISVSLFGEAENDEISSRFLGAGFPEGLKRSLKRYLEHMKDPIAIRSSSLLEDSQNQPFAGIYSTFMLPNNCDDDDLRLQQIMDAIRLVYASAFYRSARSYLRSTVHISEEEKMAVVVQRIVGNRRMDLFYPMLSGVAQSINYYPVAPLEREDGISSVALGLGKMVVEGEKVLSFSPPHPEIIPGFFSTEEVLRNSQTEFFALDLTRTCSDLSKGEDVTLRRADVQEAHPAILDYLASTYDVNDNRVRDGTGSDGTRLITFAGILKFGMVPLPEIVRKVLEIGRRGFGRPVEIEYAASLGRDGVPEFYPLQIRPLVTTRERGEVIVTDTEKEGAILLSDKALGNGSVKGLRDIVYVPFESFDVTRTVEIASEVGHMNERCCGAPYILIGPGRWGTRDRFLGIPVSWDQISCARSMAEYSAEGFRIDPSHGTHFFHNITALGIPYFSIQGSGSRMDMEALASMEVVERTDHVLHLRSEEDLEVKIDGRTGVGVLMTHIRKE